MKTHNKPFGFMQEITAVIIEDVLTEVEALKLIIREELPTIKIIGEACSYKSGVELIMKTKPIVLFMDIKLGGTLESFDVINEVYQRGYTQFVPIFITAYGSEEYATKTIDYAGGQYFRKPLDNQKLQKAMQKILEQLTLNTFNFEINKAQIEQILEQLRSNKSPEKVSVRDDEGSQVMVEMKKVIYLEAEGGKTCFVLNNDELVTSNKNLKYYDDCFSKDYNFFRIHDSILLNLNFLKKYTHKTYLVQLITGAKLKASQRQGKELKAYLSKNSPENLGWWDRFFSEE